jgi:hypothetical protein
MKSFHTTGSFPVKISFLVRSPFMYIWALSYFAVFVFTFQIKETFSVRTLSYRGASPLSCTSSSM